MALTTPNMGLTAWNSANDLFNHTVLANNFSLLDSHNHASGNGVPIPEAGIDALAVTSGKIANGAVTAGKLASGAVSSTALANNSVTGAAIANSSVTQAKIGVLPGARVQSLTDISIPNNIDTAVQFGNARYVNSGIWTIGSPTRLIAPVTGVYNIQAGLKWDTGTTGVRLVKILLNGTTVIAASDRAATTGVFYKNLSTTYNLAALDYVELIVNQTQGSSLLIKAQDALPYFGIQWISS